jgi:hypothetical protein
MLPFRVFARPNPLLTTSAFVISFLLILLRTLSLPEQNDAAPWTLSPFISASSEAHSLFSPISFVLILFRTLLHLPNAHLQPFQSLPHSFRKTPGWGYLTCGTGLQPVLRRPPTHVRLRSQSEARRQQTNPTSSFQLSTSSSVPPRLTLFQNDMLTSHDT